MLPILWLILSITFQVTVSATVKGLHPSANFLNRKSISLTVTIRIISPTICKQRLRVKCWKAKIRSRKANKLKTKMSINQNTSRDKMEYKTIWCQKRCLLLRRIDFLFKSISDGFKLFTLASEVTWIEMCASLNHRRKMKAEPTDSSKACRKSRNFNSH